MDMIRPVFQRPRTTAVPTIKTQIAVVNGATSQLDIRPTSGQQWLVNFAKIYCVSFGGSSGNMVIYYVNGADSITLARDAAPNTNDEISIASFGNGPIVVTNANFVRIEVTSTGGSSTFHLFGLAEEM